MTSPQEIWLSLDLSSNQGSLAIHRADPTTGTITLVVERAVGSRMDHSERCYLELEAALKEAQIDLSQVDRYLTTKGPGSFTGLRIAFSLLKAFALAKSRPIDTLSGSEARFLGYLSRHHDLGKTFRSVEVLTFATARKTVKAKFNLTTSLDVAVEEQVIENSEAVRPPDGTLVLLDNQLALAPWMGDRVETFPLGASLLAESLNQARTRQSFAGSEQLVALSPAYFGSAPLKRWTPN